MGPPDRERAYIYRSPAGSRRAFSLSGARSLEKQTVKARWSLIKLAPLPGRSPLIRVDPGAAHRKGPGRVLGPAGLHYAHAGRQVRVPECVRQSEWDVGYAKSMRLIRVTVSLHRHTHWPQNTRLARPAARTHSYFTRARVSSISEDVIAATGWESEEIFCLSSL